MIARLVSTFLPFFARSDVEALRMFERLMKDPNRSGSVSEYDLVYMLDFPMVMAIFRASSANIVFFVMVLTLRRNANALSFSL